MSDKKVRIGLLGTGRIGLVHAMSIAENPNVELTYVADVFIEGAEKLAAKYGGKVTADPADVFASGEVDAVVAAGEIGNLEQLTIISRDPGPAPKSYLEVSGGIFRDMTIHDFDMARFFVPNIVEVYAAGANTFSDDIREIGDFDSAVVTLRGANGELVSITNSRHASYGYDQRLEAFGDKGALLATNVSPTTVKLYNDSVVEARAPYMEFFLERYAYSYRRELELFIEGIQTGNNVNPTFEDGRAALVLADAAQLSAETGKAVKVDLS